LTRGQSDVVICCWLACNRAASANGAPQDGDPMQPFHVPDESEQIVSLEEELSKGPVAVTFMAGIGALLLGSIPRR
jgi:hypothetical protein